MSIKATVFGQAVYLQTLNSDRATYETVLKLTLEQASALARDLLVLLVRVAIQNQSL
jgi:hypothetical protein